jgi:hypothetical protein
MTASLPINCIWRFACRRCLGHLLPFQHAMSVEEVAGLFNGTVCQNMSTREGLVRVVVLRAFGVIALMVMSVALSFWFGDSLELRPLLGSQAAIALLQMRIT